MTKLSTQELNNLREYPTYRLLGLSNRRQFIKCPFHNERTPSCMIYPDGGFHCYSCGAHGKNALDFLIKGGMSFVDACLEISKLK